MWGVFTPPRLSVWRRHFPLRVVFLLLGFHRRELGVLSGFSQANFIERAATARRTDILVELRLTGFPQTFRETAFLTADQFVHRVQIDDENEITLTPPIAEKTCRDRLGFRATSLGSPGYLRGFLLFHLRLGKRPSGGQTYLYQPSSSPCL